MCSFSCIQKTFARPRLDMGECMQLRRGPYAHCSTVLCPAKQQHPGTHTRRVHNTPKRCSMQQLGPR